MLARFQESVSVIVLNPRMTKLQDHIPSNNQVKCVTVWPCWSHILQLSIIYDSWPQVQKALATKSRSGQTRPEARSLCPNCEGQLGIALWAALRGPTKRNNIKSHVIFGQVDHKGWGWPKTSPYLHSKTLRFDQFQTPQRTAMSCNSWWKSQKGSGVLATCSTPKVREVRTNTSPSNLESYNPSSSQTSFPCKPATSYGIGALHALAHMPLVQHGWGLGVMSSSKQGPIGTTNRWLLGAKASGRVAGIFPTSQTPYWAKKTARSCHKCQRQWFSFWVFW